MRSEISFTTGSMCKSKDQSQNQIKRKALSNFQLGSDLYSAATARKAQNKWHSKTHCINFEKIKPLQMKAPLAL